MPAPTKAPVKPTAEAFCTAARAVAAYALGLRGMRARLSPEWEFGLDHHSEYGRAVIEVAGREGQKLSGSPMGSATVETPGLRVVLSHATPALLQDASEAAAKLVKRYARAVRLLAEQFTAGHLIDAPTVGLAMLE